MIRRPLLLTALAALAAGCAADPSEGYSFASPYPDNVRTVAVEMFDRGEQIYRRDLEIRLTEAVVKQIQLSTPYRVTTRDEADTLLTGEINRVTQQVMSMQPNTGRPRELEITLRTSFRWQDLRTGRIIKQVKNLPVSATYIPQPPAIDENFFLGSADLVDRLARHIVERMEKTW